MSSLFMRILAFKTLLYRSFLVYTVKQSFRKCIVGQRCVETVLVLKLSLFSGLTSLNKSIVLLHLLMLRAFFLTLAFQSTEHQLQFIKMSHYLFHTVQKHLKRHTNNIRFTETSHVSLKNNWQPQKLTRNKS